MPTRQFHPSRQGIERLQGNVEGGAGKLYLQRFTGEAKSNFFRCERDTESYSSSQKPCRAWERTSHRDKRDWHANPSESAAGRRESNASVAKSR